MDIKQLYKYAREFKKLSEGQVGTNLSKKKIFDIFFSLFKSNYAIIFDEVEVESRGMVTYVPTNPYGAKISFNFMDASKQNKKAPEIEGIIKAGLMGSELKDNIHSVHVTVDTGFAKKYKCVIQFNGSVENIV